MSHISHVLNHLIYAMINGNKLLAKLCIKSFIVDLFAYLFTHDAPFLIYPN
jgi:hypothetical protein